MLWILARIRIQDLTIWHFVLPFNSKEVTKKPQVEVLKLALMGCKSVPCLDPVWQRSYDAGSINTQFGFHH